MKILNETQISNKTDNEIGEINMLSANFRYLEIVLSEEMSDPKS